MSDLPRPNEVKVEPLSYKELAERFSTLKADNAALEAEMSGYKAEMYKSQSEIVDFEERSRRAEAKLSKMEEALNFIAFTGTDCPAGYERDSFYRGQLHGTIAAAAKALAGGEEA